MASFCLLNPIKLQAAFATSSPKESEGKHIVPDFGVSSPYVVPLSLQDGDTIGESRRCPSTDLMIHNI